MKQIVRCVLLACVLALTIRPNAHAGTYFLVERDVHYNDPTQQGNYGPYIIVHPPGYTGAPGVLTVNICVEPGSETLIPAIQWAIDTWNARKARYGNCRSCLTWEQKAQAPTGPVVLNTVTLHELGHCALGLGHSNEQEWNANNAPPPTLYPSGVAMTGTCDLDSNSSCGDDSSYSAVVNATEVVSGSLGEPRGGGGDLPINQCPHLSGMVTRPVYPNFGKLDVPEASWREVEDDMAHPLCSPPARRG